MRKPCVASQRVCLPSSPYFYFLLRWYPGFPFPFLSCVQSVWLVPCTSWCKRPFRFLASRAWNNARFSFVVSYFHKIAVGTCVTAKFYYLSDSFAARFNKKLAIAMGGNYLYTAQTFASIFGCLVCNGALFKAEVNSKLKFKN